MKIKEQKLIFNALQCAKCDDVIVSTHRHDFRYCKCGAIAVDGGNEYSRWVGDIHNAKDLSEYEEIIREETDWEREWREKGWGVPHGREYIEE
jgi:ribosomal protein S27AE